MRLRLLAGTVLALLGSCTTITYYQAPPNTPLSKFTIISNPKFRVNGGVHYANNANCTGYEQLHEPKAGGDYIVNLEANKEHSFGISAMLDFSVTGGGGGTVRTVRTSGCPSYISFFVREGYEYRYLTDFDGSQCAHLLQMRQAGAGQWSAADFRSREFVPGLNCR